MEKYIVETGPVTKIEKGNVTPVLKNLLNCLASDKWVIVNITQTYAGEREGWLFNVIAKKEVCH